MVAEGFATKRGRRAALVHRDEVNGRLRGRRGARLHAISSGGAIPEVADYRVVLDPEDTFIGTLNEDFAIESTAGDVFQLGNASWRVLQVGAGVVRVADAKGAPPTLPFWLGEAPARSDELSRAVSDLRADVDGRLKAALTDNPFRPAVDWFAADIGVAPAVAEQAIAYLAAGRDALGVLPTQDTLVLERFFDESGGMQLVLHAPFGSRINKAWGLALRKRFCRQFNFELQAAATEDALLLSLGPQHSFPLADVFRYLHSATAKEVLIQAFLDAPVFQTRWRWNTTISLAVPRNRHGRKVPPPLQRMLADDLMAAVFPDAAACLENIPGDRDIPDHPLVNQTVRDCLEEAMDLPGLTAVLDRIHGGEICCVARDTPEPSPLSHEILNARPYAFLDDAPLEERRAQAVYTRRAGEPASAADLGALDAAAIARVRDEVRPDPRDADELHDAIVTAGFLTRDEASEIPAAYFERLRSTRRAAVAHVARPFAACPATVWCAAERLPELRAVHPGVDIEPSIEPTASRAANEWTRDAALVELLRGRLAIVGPTTAMALADSLAVAAGDVDAALLTLETEGVVLRGSFSMPGTLEWCDRRLLARIHRYTLNRLRAEIEPVSPADFMRFLFAWQHAAPGERLSGVDGVRRVIERLDGFELAADAWERAVLPARVDGYNPSMLDLLCLTGDVGWARVSAPGTDATQMVAATPIALFQLNVGADPRVQPPPPSVHERATATHAEAHEGEGGRSGAATSVDRGDSEKKDTARRILDVLRARGASFVHEIVTGTQLDAPRVRAGLADLVSAGLVTSDGFGGLRSIIRADSGKHAAGAARATVTGRWFALRSMDPHTSNGDAEHAAAVERQAWALLRRYGVLFRKLLTREANAAPWRELARVCRRLEARGEIRGGRFVAGMSGEQFALGDAVEQLREVRRLPADGRLVAISAVDPLNLAGIVTTGDRVRAIASNRVVYRNGVPLAALEGDYMRPLVEVAGLGSAAASEVASVLTGRSMPAVLSGFVGR